MTLSDSERAQLEVWARRPSSAQALVQRAAARCPEIIPFLESTGLGNSPDSKSMKVLFDLA